MRKGVLFLVAVLALVEPVSAQTSNWADKLFQGVTSHDFGTVPRGAQLKYTFQMKNIYKVPLEITSLRATCGCVTYTVPKKMLQPNETAVVNINMDATRFSGSKTVTLYVSVGPEYVSTATLRVTANARQDVVFNPGEVNFGLTNRGQTLTKILDVEYAGVLDWRIHEVVKSAGAPFQLRIEELSRSAGLAGYRFFLTLKADGQPGPFKTELLLKTNDPQSPLLTVAVEGNIQANLSAAPSVVNLGDVKAGEAQTKKVMIRGNRPFRILSINGQGDGIAADLPERSAASQIVTLRFQPDRVGVLQKQLLVSTDLDQESVTVTVEANVVP